MYFSDRQAFGICTWKFRFNLSCKNNLHFCESGGGGILALLWSTNQQSHKFCGLAGQGDDGIANGKLINNQKKTLFFNIFFWMIFCPKYIGSWILLLDLSSGVILGKCSSVFYPQNLRSPFVHSLPTRPQISSSSSFYTHFKSFSSTFHIFCHFPAPIYFGTFLHLKIPAPVININSYVHPCSSMRNACFWRPPLHQRFLGLVASWVHTAWFIVVIICCLLSALPNAN